MFEQRLKAKAGEGSTALIEYTLDGLYAYLDALNDIGLMVFNPTIRAYEPKDRSWIKMQVFKGLQESIGKSA